MSPRRTPQALTRIAFLAATLGGLLFAANAFAQAEGGAAPPAAPAAEPPAAAPAAPPPAAAPAAPPPAAAAPAPAPDHTHPLPRLLKQVGGHLGLVIPFVTAANSGTSSIKDAFTIGISSGLGIPIV